MSSQSITVGPIVAMYVGDSTGMDVLTPIMEARTGGISFNYNIGEDFLDVVGNSVQSSRASLQTNVTFFGNDPTIVKLANGLSLSATNSYDPSTFNLYEVLMLSADPTKPSILIPNCYTLKKINLNFDKDKLSVVPVTFFATNRNRFTQLFYLDTQEVLAGILGGRSPI